MENEKAITAKIRKSISKLEPTHGHKYDNYISRDGFHYVERTNLTTGQVEEIFDWRYEIRLKAERSNKYSLTEYINPDQWRRTVDAYKRQGRVFSFTKIFIRRDGKRIEKTEHFDGAIKVSKASFCGTRNGNESLCGQLREHEKKQEQKRLNDDAKRKKPRKPSILAPSYKSSEPVTIALPHNVPRETALDIVSANPGSAIVFYEAPTKKRHEKPVETIRIGKATTGKPVDEVTTKRCPTRQGSVRVYRRNPAP